MKATVERVLTGWEKDDTDKSRCHSGEKSYVLEGNAYNIGFMGFGI